MVCNTICVELSTFKAWFPALDGITREQLEGAYEGAKSIISTNYGEIVLPKDLQKRGVYLATAHQYYISKNPDIVSQGKVANASEGSVSAGFVQPQYKNWLDYWLSLSPYGVELLGILTQVQPPLPRRPIGANPYYKGAFFC